MTYIMKEETRKLSLDPAAAEFEVFAQVYVNGQFMSYDYDHTIKYNVVHFKFDLYKNDKVDVTYTVDLFLLKKVMSSNEGELALLATSPDYRERKLAELKLNGKLDKLLTISA